MEFVNTSDLFRESNHTTVGQIQTKNTSGSPIPIQSLIYEKYVEICNQSGKTPAKNHVYRHIFNTEFNCDWVEVNVIERRTRAGLSEPQFEVRDPGLAKPSGGLSEAKKYIPVRSNHHPLI